MDSILRHTLNAIAISAKLLQARENPSGGILKILKLSNEHITANTKANADKPVSTHMILDMIYLLILFNQ